MDVEEVRSGQEGEMHGEQSGVGDMGDERCAEEDGDDVEEGRGQEEGQDEGEEDGLGR